MCSCVQAAYSMGSFTCILQQAADRTMQFKKPSADSETIRHRMTKLINASAAQPRIIKRNLGVWQKYMVFVLLEMKRNCWRVNVCLKWRWTEARFSPAVQRGSLLTVPTEGRANHRWLLKIRSLCFYYQHQLSTPSGGPEINEWTCYREGCYFIPSASAVLTENNIEGLQRLDAWD